MTKKDTRQKVTFKTKFGTQTGRVIRFFEETVFGDTWQMVEVETRQSRKTWTHKMPAGAVTFVK